MSTAAYAQHTEWETLLRTWCELNVPEDWRAEVFDGGIHLMPPPDNDHNEIAFLVSQDLSAILRANSWRAYQTSGATIDRIERLHMPDLLVIPRSAVTLGGFTVSAAELLLAVEITSKSNAQHDRKAKLWSYAHAPVPLYLLIDRFDPAGPHSTLYSEPVDGTYRRDVRIPFGQPIRLPKPFGVEIATAEFPA
jgi:Uma2 family endonuclease